MGSQATSPNQIISLPKGGGAQHASVENSHLIYVDDRKITNWINQNGNEGSDLVDIAGTPPVSGLDATRLLDLLSSGISGVLWTQYQGGLR